MNEVGDGLNAKNAQWSFGGDTHKTFDAHVSKSVPFYSDGHSIIEEVSDFFLSDGSLVYDIGCSTGTLLEKLAIRNINKKIQFIGCEPEIGMTHAAIEKCKKHKNISIVNESILDIPMEKADLISSYYTIQFLHPSIRQDVFDKIYNSLNWGGAFIFFEKVRAPDARFQDMMSLIYNEYKFSQGYTPQEVITKSKSLKGVLEPFSSQANIDLASRAGFKDVMSVFKYVCFEGFLAIK